MCTSARSCSNKVESSAGSPHASDITNFGSLYTTWLGQEMTFVISEIRYKRDHYIEVLLYIYTYIYIYLAYYVPLKEGYQDKVFSIPGDISLPSPSVPCLFIRENTEKGLPRSHDPSIWSPLTNLAAAPQVYTVYKLEPRHSYTFGYCIFWFLGLFNDL